MNGKHWYVIGLFALLLVVFPIKTQAFISEDYCYEDCIYDDEYDQEDDYSQDKSGSSNGSVLMKYIRVTSPNGGEILGKRSGNVLLARSIQLPGKPIPMVSN